MVFTKILSTPGLSRGLLLTIAVAMSFQAISGQTTSTSGGQAPAAPAQTAPSAGELYGGIELAADSVTSIALSISKKDDDGGLKLLYSDTAPLVTRRERNWKAGSKTLAEGMQEILKAMGRLQTEWKVPYERIYIIGGSELKGDQPDELVQAVLKITGKTLTYLEPEMETQLAIAGVIAQRAKVGESFIDNRNYSLWICLDSYTTKGGYQRLRYTPSVEYDFVAMNLSLGAVNFTDLVVYTTSESAGWTTLVGQAKFLAGGALKDQLRKEVEAKPGLLTRKRIYLTGGVPSAIAALLYPEDRQSYVTLTMKDIEDFAAKAANNPRALLNPTISRAVKPELKQEIEKDFAAVRKRFTTQELMAGAEFLRVLSTELNWRDKNIRFARFGRLTSILGYLRLQAGK
jgi:hypothetical protein